MPRAFEGIRIIDFTQVLAGPFATAQLAGLGADVIKIEQPGTGDQTRSLLGGPEDAGMTPSFLTCNHGKRSLTLNLKAAEARDIVLALVRSADVVVENFTPGVMERLGLGADVLCRERAGLIYCSISGYGQSGPNARQAAYDGAIQAASGMMAVSGHPETGPTRTGYMPVDMATALNAAFAIAAALYRRSVTGEGQRLDVAMMDTALALHAPQVSAFLVKGSQPPLLGNRSPTRQPTANVFATADGFVQVVALKEAQVARLFDVLGLTDRYAEPEFATVNARIDGREAVDALLAPAFRSSPTAHWLGALAAAGVPVAEIRDYAAVTADPQFAGRPVFAEVPAPARAGQTVKVVAAAHTADTDPPRVDRAPPRLGEHTDEILSEIGYSAGQIAALRTGGVI
jgi:crotonobetainyl-CoA:carnitine CoA-transferase CaiB-like acyl-CoA transferase